MSIGTTAFLRIRPTAMWRPGAPERGVLEPGMAAVPLTAIGIETVIGIVTTTVIGTATGIMIATTVLGTMTVDCIADGTNTIAMMMMIATGIMTGAAAAVTTGVRIMIATKNMTEITTMTTTANNFQQNPSRCYPSGEPREV